MPELDLGDIAVAYERHGGGAPPLLLVHGFSGGQIDWVDVVGPLSRDRSVVTYDHRGHGETTNTGDAATYTFDQLTNDLERIVDALELDRFDLLGHSMGGVLSMRYVLAHPERVRSLVLMDTFAEPALTIPKEWIDHVMRIANEQGMAAVAKSFAAATADTDATVVERLIWKFEHLDKVAFESLAEQLHTYPSLLDRLGEIACPCTVVVGENDTGLRAPADVLAAKIRGAVLSVIPDAAHSPQVENRDVWLATIEAHLARADREG